MPGRPLTRQSKIILAEMDGDPDFWDDCFSRIACGESFKSVMSEYNVLEGVARMWVADRPVLSVELQKAERCWADVKEFERLEIADEATPESVQVAKLRSETRHSLGSRLARGKWGDTQTHLIDDRRGLGTEAEMREQLAEIFARNPDVLQFIEGEYAEVLQQIAPPAPAEPINRVAVEAHPPADIAACHGAATAAIPVADFTERQVAASVYEEPALAKKPRKKRGEPKAAAGPVGGYL